MREHDSEGCCCGCSSEGLCGVSRRGFLTAGALAAALPAAGVLGAEADPKRRQQPIRRPLRVQPVFNCTIYQSKPATSWRVTGAIQDEVELHAEEEHIRADLKAMQTSAEFPLEVLPLVTVRTVEEAKGVAKRDFDVQVIYAARRDLPVLEALADNDKWNLMFVRHRSGPLYYMYIGSHSHFLRKRRDEWGQRNMNVSDIVVDDHGDPRLPLDAGLRQPPPPSRLRRAKSRAGLAGGDVNQIEVWEIPEGGPSPNKDSRAYATAHGCPDQKAGGSVVRPVSFSMEDAL